MLPSSGVDSDDEAGGSGGLDAPVRLTYLILISPANSDSISLDCPRDGSGCLLRRAGSSIGRDYQVPQTVVEGEESPYRNGHRDGCSCAICRILEDWALHVASTFIVLVPFILQS